MGNFSGETVIGKTGSSIPAEVVRSLLDSLVERDENRGIRAEPFSLPVSYSQTSVCALSGLRPGAACPSVTREFAPLGLEDTLPSCNWHYYANGRISFRYPGEYQRWFSGKNTDAVLFSEKIPLAFLYPANGAVFVYDNALTNTIQRVATDCVGGSENTARLYVNGVFAGESARPFSWNVPLTQGELVLTVQCGNETASVSVTVK
jgi:penicillin-binding protein 1C